MSSLKRDKKESGLYDDSLRLLFVLLVAGLGSGACDTEELLKVELPGEVTQEDLADPALAQVLVNSVVADSNALGPIMLQERPTTRTNGSAPAAMIA